MSDFVEERRQTNEESAELAEQQWEEALGWEINEDSETSKAPTIVDVEKGRVYVDDESEAPAGAQVHEGEQGGLYYNPSEEEEATDDADSSGSAPDNLSELEVGDEVAINGRPGTVEGVGAFGDAIDFYDEQDDEVYTVREEDVDSIESRTDVDAGYEVDPLDTSDPPPTATSVDDLMPDTVKDTVAAMEDRYESVDVTSVKTTYSDDLGYFDVSTGVVHLNVDGLEDLVENEEKYEEWLSSTTVESVVTHEIIHQMHYENEVPEERELEDGEEELLEEEVSGYAAYNPLEAVAEIGAGLLAGEEYPEQVMDIYEKYGGPEL